MVKEWAKFRYGIFDEQGYQVNFKLFFHIYLFMYTGSLQKFDGVECFTVLNINGGLLI